MKKFIKSALLGCAAILTGCQTDELCYTHPHDGEYFVEFDWSDAPEAQPASMRVIFYGEEGGEPFMVDLPAEGGKVRMLETTCHVLTYNVDTEWITYAGTEAYHTHMLTTRDGSLLEPLGVRYRSSTVDVDVTDDRVAVAPEPIWGVGQEGVRIVHGDTLTLRPQQLYCHYSFEVRNVGSLSHVESISATISGMADGVNPATGRRSDTSCTIPVEAAAGADDNSIVGEFYTFGHLPDMSARHRMAFYVVTTDGKHYKYVDGDGLDVTDQIHGAANERRVHLVLDNALTLPEEFTPEVAGFDVTLGEWKEENKEINI